MVGRGKFALGALALLVFVGGQAEADHCGAGITVHGRATFAPGVVPPPTPRACPALEMADSTGHVLAPGTGEIFVRVHADAGTSYPVLVLRLEGLGFANQSYPLVRTQSATGVFTYDVDDWLGIPDPRPQGKLLAKVRFPGDHEAVAEYALLTPSMR